MVHARADEHLRLVDVSSKDFVGLYLTIAGLIVRSPGLRQQLDANALPTLLDEMRARLEVTEASGKADPEVVAALRRTLQRSGAVALDPNPNRHHAALVPLIRTIATTLRLNHLAAVRQLDEPGLHTGSDPVVLYPTHRFDEGMPCARLLIEGAASVRMWHERHNLLSAVERIVSGIAGLAFALDPRTLVLLFDPESEKGSNLMFAASQIRWRRSRSPTY